MRAFCSILDQSTLGPRRTSNTTSARNTIYTFKHMHTELFTPSKELLDKVVQGQGVVDYLRDTVFQDPVYMVTGIKTVIGTSVTTFNSKCRAVNITLGIDAVLARVPLNVGPELDFMTLKGNAGMRRLFCLMSKQKSDGLKTWPRSSSLEKKMTRRFESVFEM
jgi:hypothetical protein